MHNVRLAALLMLATSITACTRAANPANQWTPAAPASLPTNSTVLTYLPPTRVPGTPAVSPTPDEPLVFLPTFTPLAQEAVDTQTPGGPLTYIVQPGDYPALIANQFNITVEELSAANNIDFYSVILYPGEVLIIPTPEGQAAVPLAANPAPAAAAQFDSSNYFKIIPDSELVYSPLATLLDVETYVQQRGGYLAYYTQNVDGQILTGAQIVQRVAQNYSVNPRILLAILEYRSQWVSNPNPAPSTLELPIGYITDFHFGLYRQLTWTADRLNEGFYNWQAGTKDSWTLIDGTVTTPSPGINAGTAGVQFFFSNLDDRATWEMNTGPNGLYATYSAMFGYPFDWAIEPYLPAGLSQPTLNLPFAIGETWSFTGGPHGGWDSGSAWAALDFAPPGDPIGCAISTAWVLAAADGLITRAGDGAVIQDLDGDGIEQTGWTILYMHIAAVDRVSAGTYVRAGERIGRPSCEGGFSSAAHLHIARRYNGMWIAAVDPNLPFVMDGWQAHRGTQEYDGRLIRGDQVVEAWDGLNPINEIRR